jgi:DNA-directed RNA polymerase subunit RPC12/RpoP
MSNICFNCGKLINDENDVYYELVGIAGTIYFCSSCGKYFNISNIKNNR